MAPESRDEVAQRDEVRQRIESLYDRAENATGNYNATRAMASAARSRRAAATDRSGRRRDPAADEVTRTWFAAVRAEFGPTVPAVLPADRLPDRPVAPGRSRERMEGGAPDGVRNALEPGRSARRPEALERAVDRVVAELTAGRATDPESLALAARGSGRPALPGPRRPELPGGSTDSADLEAVRAAGLGAVETAVLPVAAIAAAQDAPVQEPRTLPRTTAPDRPSPAVSKANNQRKLAAASDVISRYAARLVTSAAAVQSTLLTTAPTATDTWAAPTVPVTPDPAAHAPMASVTDTGSLAPVVESPEVVRVAKAVAFARAQLGKPCVWGATGPDSYDCSSLTQAAWKAAGVTLPRAAHQQALAGTPVALDGIEPGDLVLFFDDDRHVGLHVGGGVMVHAPGPGSSIREESIYGAGESAIHRVVRPA
ncbi:C40 family peptidase [Streptomyces yokosukanensis]|nr:C40 family peptidase [Streptomyces yokosukanensis]